MYTINDDLSKELKVEPLKKGEVVEFRLIRAGLIDLMTGKPSQPQGHMIPGIEVIYDPFAKRNVRIINITDFTAIPQNGKETIYQPNTASVSFPRSSSIVINSPEQNDLLYFMRRTSYNRDNKYRSGRYHPIFFEVNKERDTRVQIDITEYKRLALNIVADRKDGALVALAYELNESGGFKIDMNAKGADLRRSLNIIAETQPKKLILGSTDERSKLKVYIDDAISELKILFDAEKRMWYWHRENGKGVNITKIDEGNDPKDGLIDFLTTDKQASRHRTELITVVGKEETHAHTEADDEAARVARAIGGMKNPLVAEIEKAEKAQGK